ncbi:MAG: biotin/lipoyl-containing protein [Clostridia bacterium]
MRNFLVSVNGTNYEVAVEEIDGSKAAQTAPKATPAAVAAPTPAAAPTTGGTAVNSPMPGNILAVNVKNGDAVKRGQILMILEAMKMENEILAPVDGIVTNVSVEKGSTVESGSLLCSIG